MMAAAVWLTVAHEAGLACLDDAQHHRRHHRGRPGPRGAAPDGPHRLGGREESGDVLGRKPLLGGIIAFLSFWIVRETILESKNPEERSMWLARSSLSRRSSYSGHSSSVQGVEGALQQAGRCRDARQGVMAGSQGGRIVQPIHALLPRGGQSR